MKFLLLVLCIALGILGIGSIAMLVVWAIPYLLVVPPWVPYAIFIVPSGSVIGIGVWANLRINR